MKRNSVCVKDAWIPAPKTIHNCPHGSKRTDSDVVTSKLAVRELEIELAVVALAAVVCQELLSEMLDDLIPPVK